VEAHANTFRAALMQLTVFSTCSKPLHHLDNTYFRLHTELSAATECQSERGRKAPPARSLSELHRGEHGLLDRLDLPDDQALRLMELVFFRARVWWRPTPRRAAIHASIA